jgi:intein/homing endonuclease
LEIKGVKMAKTNEEENKIRNDQIQKTNEKKEREEKSRGTGGNTSCFLGSTPILTPEGWRPISDLKKGDRIISYDKPTGTTAIRHIKEQRRHKSAKIWEVFLTQCNEPICTTRIHSFLTNSGWKRASQLKSGDILATVGGSTGVVSSIVETDRFEPVFNLITEGEHTFVAQGCVVHNFTYFRTLRVWWHIYTLRSELAETRHYAQAN